MSDTTELERAVLGLNPAAPAQDLFALWNRLKAAEQFLKEVKGYAHEKMSEWIEINGEPQDGSIRLRIANPATTKCLDVRDAVEAIFTETGGDMDAMVSCLSANALKPGACKAVLSGEQFDRLFKVERKPKVEEGKPKRVEMVDEQFIRKGAARQ